MPEKFNPFQICLFIIISAFAAWFSASKVYSLLEETGRHINLDDSVVPEVIPSAESCESSYAVNEVLSLFKENDPFYKNISLKSIDTHEIKDKEILYKNDNETVYVCSGKISAVSAPGGFRPSGFDEDNLFYNRVLIENDDLRIKKYTSYEVPVIYISQMTKNGNSVEIQGFGEGIFTCGADCAPVFKSEAEEEIFRTENERLQKIEQAENERKLKKKEKSEKHGLFERKEQIENTDADSSKHFETDKKKPSKLKRIFGFFRRK